MNCLILFAKAPRPGNVKTRMIPALGELRASELHWSLVNDMVERVLVPLNVGDQSGNTWAVQLYSDDVKSEKILQLSKEHAFPLFKQQGKSLGEKMSAAFAQALQQYDRVVLCGSDSLDFNRTHCESLAAALDEADIAIAPALDGGYIAIAAKRLSPLYDVMQNIDWGTSRVFTQTQLRANSAGLTVKALSPVKDIDYPEDLQGTRYADWL